MRLAMFAATLWLAGAAVYGQDDCGVQWECRASYDPSKQVGVIDVGYETTADATACFEACIAHPGCNTASWGPAYQGCHLRSIAASQSTIKAFNFGVDWQDTFRFPANCRPTSAPEYSCRADNGCLAVATTPSEPHTPTASSAAWEAMPELPIALGEIAAGVLPLNGKNYLVVIGESDYINHPEQEGLTAIYDFEEGTWVTGAKRPYVGNHHTSQGYGGKWYIVGGFGAEPYVQVGQLFDNNGTVDIEWTVAASEAPILTASAGSWLVGDKIHYCGGIKGSFTVATCAVYDITTDTWSTDMPPLIKGANHAASCAQPGGALLLFGGRGGGNEYTPGYNETQIFDNGNWTLGAPLPLARGSVGRSMYSDGKCYVFGGEFGCEVTPSPELRITGDFASYAVDVYDIATDSWSQGPDLPIGMHGTYAIKYGGYIHIAGGGTKSQFSQSKLHYRLAV